MNTSFDGLFAELEELGKQPFEPKAFYHADGDFLEFITSPEPYFARRLDGMVTVYMSRDGQDIVGARIKGIKRVLAKCKKGCNILIRDGDGIPVHRIVVIALWENSGQGDGEMYRRICELAESRPIKGGIEIPELAGCGG